MALLNFFFPPSWSLLKDDFKGKGTKLKSKFLLIFHQ